MPPKALVRDAHTLHRVEPTPNGEKTSQLLRRNTEHEPARTQHGIAAEDRTGARQVGYRGDMARNADALPVEPVIDLVDDGLSDSEIATRFAEWLSDLDAVPVVVLPVSAIDELRNAYADDDV